MERIDYLSLLRWLAPEVILAMAALVVLIADLFAMQGVEPRIRRIILGMLGGAGCVAASIWLLMAAGTVHLPEGLIVLSPVSTILKVAILGLTLAALLLFVETTFTEHAGEFVSLILLAAIGMLLLVSSENLLVIFLSFELTSICLYVLAALDRRNPASAEAALKYFLFGGVSATFTLFGISLLYGISGSLYLPHIASSSQAGHLDSLLVLGMVLSIAGFGFKIAAVPFHFWAPDVYEGAPSPSAAIVASASKVAGFFIFARVLLVGFHGLEGSAVWQFCRAGWVPVLAALAVASMLLGNFVAIVQSRFRRLLAYSAIAHTGYALIAIMAHQGPGLAALIYYIITYGITLAGIFGVVTLLESSRGNDAISNLAGWGRTSPVMAFCLLTFMLSLAGVPPFAGFFGKFYVFAAVLKNHDLPGGNFWIVLTALALSVVSLYYYLQVLKQVYVTRPEVEGTSLERPWFAQGVVLLAAMAVLILGIFPGLLLHPIIQGLKAL
jgi:NADH-quinone oxidoreductase subunit N